MKLAPLGRLDEPGRVLFAALSGEALCVMVGRVDATVLLCLRLGGRRAHTLWRQPLSHAPGAALSLWAAENAVGVVAGRLRRVFSLADGRVLAKAQGNPPIAAVALEGNRVTLPTASGIERLEADTLVSSAIQLDPGESVAGGAGAGFVPVAGRSGRALLRLSDGARWALPEAAVPCGLGAASDGTRVALPLGRAGRAASALVVLSDGQLGWRSDLLGDVDPETLPALPLVVDEGVVFAAGAGRVIEARTLDEGTALWASPLGVPATALAVAAGIAWVGCGDGTLTAFDAFAGERIGTRSVRTRPGLLSARREAIDAAEHPVWLGVFDGGLLCACRLGALWHATSRPVVTGADA